MVAEWGTVSARETVANALNAVDRLEPKLNAYVQIDRDGASTRAQALDAAVDQGEPVGALFGMPVAVKDNIAVEGLRFTGGSRCFEDRIAKADSPVVARLKAAGAVIVGKTTMPEFGHTAAGRSHLFGTTRNPWDLNLSTGGSSSGSAASVASGCVPAALGTDGGGSVRIPASFCGLVTIKPNVGRVPYVPSSPTLVLAHIGPITRTVRAAAALLDVMAGPDPGEAAALPAQENGFLSCLSLGCDGMRVAYAPTLFGATVDPAVSSAIDATIDALASALPIDLQTVDLEEIEDPLRDFITLWIAGQGTNVHDLYGGALDRLDPGLAQIVERARTELDAQSVTRAYWARGAFIEKLERYFQSFDLLLTPTCACLPFPAEATSVELGNGDSMAWAEMVRFTYPFNFSGHPAASIPGRPTADGVPVGLQIVGPRFREDLVLRLAARIEQVVPWHSRRPRVWAGTD